VRYGWFLLVYIAVHCVDSLEYHADVDGYTILNGAVEAVIKACVEHVVDGGRRSDGDDWGGVFGTAVSCHCCVHVVHF